LFFRYIVNPLCRRQEPNKWDLFAALWHHFSSGPGGKDRTCTNSVSIVPVAILFIGLTAEPYHTHAIWYWMINALGIFRMDRLDPEDLEIYTEQPHYFWLGEVGMASILAGTFAVPAGIYLTGRTGIALAFILAIIVFMPLF